MEAPTVFEATGRCEIGAVGDWGSPMAGQMPVMPAASWGKGAGVAEFAWVLANHACSVLEEEIEAFWQREAAFAKCGL